MSQIAQRLIANLQSQFPQELQTMDTNRDGTISRDELVQCLFRCGVGDWCSAHCMANEVFQALDRNHDGRLTRDEVHQNCGGFAGYCNSLPLCSPANGSVFCHFPRHTTLTWRPVACVTNYLVEIDFEDRCGWTRLQTQHVCGPYFQFNFVGAQRGRWRVTALDANNHEIAKSDWWIFTYRV